MTPEQITNLENAAHSWVGTPFCEHSQAKGAGVSCHLLAGAILRESGIVPSLPDLPDAPTGWSRSHTKSLIAEWLDGPGSAWFAPVGTPGTEDGLEAGDVMLFRIGHTGHHVAVRLDRGRLVSAMENVGCRIAPNMTNAWRRRLVRAWRPIP